MRHPEKRGNAGGQWVIRRSRTFEDAEAFVAEPAPADAIDVQNSPRCAARQDQTVEWVLCSAHSMNLCQASPVWFVRSVWGSRLCPGHDQTVEVAIPQILDARIETV